MKNRICLALLLMAIAFCTTKADEITFNSVTLEPGEQAELVINANLTNANLTSYQFDIYLPEGISVAYDDDEEDYVYALSGRHKKDHTLSLQEHSDYGFWRFIVSSNSNKLIRSGEGELLTLTLQASATASGTHTVQVKNIKMAEPDQTSHVLNNTSFGLTVNSVVVNATSVSLDRTTLSLTSAEQTTRLIATVLPTNATNKTVTWTSSNTAVATVDASGLVTAKSNGTATITATTTDGSNKSATCEVTVNIPVATDEFTFNSVTIDSGDQAELVINATLSNANITSYQFDIYLPEGISVAYDDDEEDYVYALSGRHKKDHTLSLQEHSDYGFWRFIVSSNSNKLIRSGEGELLTLTLQASPTASGTHTVQVKNIKMAEPDQTSHVLNNASFGLTINTVIVNATSVSLDKTTLSFTSINQTTQLTATVLPTNATNKSVTWTSSNTNVATVSSSGVVTSKGNGTATITATTTDGSNKSATCSVTVDAPILVTGVSLSQTSLTFSALNATQTLTATVTPSNAANKTLTWTSSNTNVATVSSSGVVTSKGNGTATITATTTDGSNKSATCSVTVAFSIPVTGVSLSQASLTFSTLNTTQTLTATVTPSNATNKTLTWTSSNTKVATVSSSGVVTSKGNGTATITAKATDGSNKSATCSVTVSAPILVTGVSLSQTSLTFSTLNTTQTLTATVTPSNAANKTLTWTSSNTNVATVSSSGVVTSKSNGTATITAKATDGSNISATCTVLVQSSAEAISEGYYTIISAGKGPGYYTGTNPGDRYNDEGKYALYNDAGLVMWKAFDANDFSQIYHITSGGDGDWYIYNLADGSYIDRQYVEGIPLGQSVYAGKVITSTDKNTPQVIEETNQTNKWTIRFKGNEYVYGLTVGHNGAGDKTSGEISIWGSNAEAQKYGMNVWYFNKLPEATDIVLNLSELALAKGQTQQLTATVSPANALPIVAWESSNPYVATVSEDGLITAKSSGTATITATTTDGSNKSATCTVSVQSSAEAISEGYYTIVSAGKGPGYYTGTNPGDRYNDEGKYALYNDGGIVKWKAFDENDHSLIYHITSSGDGDWYVYNLTDGSYIDRNNEEATLYRQSYYGGKVTTSTGKNTPQVIEKTNQPDKWTIRFQGNEYVYGLTASHNGAETYTSGVITIFGSNAEAQQYGMNVWNLNKFPETTDIVLNHSELVLAKGQTQQQLTATVSPANALPIVAWESSDPDVATVSEDGLVTAKGYGTATITATTTDGSNLSAICSVTVATNVDLTDIAHWEVTYNASYGYTFKDIATGYYMNTRGDSSTHQAITYHTGQSDKGSCWKLLDSKGNNVVSFNTQEEYYLYNLGGWQGGYAYENKDDQRIFILAPDLSSAEPIQLISDGNGYYYICMNGKYIAQPSKDIEDLKLKEITLPTATNISIDYSELTLVEGQTQQFTATVSPANAWPIVIWESSDPNVATVSESGLVTAKSYGTATITATTTDGSNKEATCSITVVTNAYLTGIAHWEVEYNSSSQSFCFKDVKTGYYMNSSGSSSTRQAITYHAGQSDNGSCWKLLDSKGNNVVSFNTQERYYLCNLRQGYYAYENKDDQRIFILATNISSAEPIQLISDGNGYYYIYMNGKYVAQPSKEIEDLILEEITLTTATSISIDYSELSLEKGKTQYLKATVTPTEALQSVTWKSSNESVATVSENGLVTAKSNGTARITATTADGSNLSATCTVTVTIPVDGISLSNTSLTFSAIDSKETLTATVTPSNASNKNLEWTSSNPDVATVSSIVSSRGVVTAKGNGTATITARAKDGSNISASCTVTVTIPVDGISLSNTSLTFSALNTTQTLTATVSPSSAANKKLTWTSSNTSVATVSSNGVVTSKGNGTATITAKATDGSNISATCSVTVAAPILVTGVSLNKTSLTFSALNTTQTLTATVTPSNASNKILTWTSSNTDVATVNIYGVVTSKGYGTATITATATDGSNKSATCSVTVVIPKYTLKFVADGKVVSETSVEYGSAITAPNAPAKTGYTFVSWGNVAATMPAKDVTYTAQYKINQYKLTYLIDGRVYKTYTLDYNSVISPEEDAEDDDYYYGWEDIPNRMPDHDVTVNAYITGIAAAGKGITNGKYEIYTIDGKKLNNLQKGINIIRTADGKTKKVVVK